MGSHSENSHGEKFFLGSNWRLTHFYWRQCRYNPIIPHGACVGSTSARNYEQVLLIHFFYINFPSIISLKFTFDRQSSQKQKCFKQVSWKVWLLFLADRVTMKRLWLVFSDSHVLLLLSPTFFFYFLELKEYIFILQFGQVVVPNNIPKPLIRSLFPSENFL